MASASRCIVLRSIGLRWILPAVLVISGIPSVGQANQTTVVRAGNVVSVTTAQDHLWISVCGPSVIHILGAPSATPPTFVPEPWILHDCNDSAFTLSNSSGVASLKTSALQVRIDLRSGALAFTTEKGEELLSEGCQPCASPGSSRTYLPLSQSHDPLYRVGELFWMPDNQALYGLGQHQSGSFNYRGTATILDQVNTDIAIPFMVSTKGYGILWNSASRSEVDNRFPKLLKFTASAGKGLDYYFFYGPELDTLIHRYRELTGRAPLYPEWAYGFFQSKDHYTSQDQLEQVVVTSRSRQIPLDTIVQDWQWWTKWGAATFNSHYPDFPDGVRSIHDHHAHVMLSIWPKFDPETAIWKEMNEKHFLLPDNKQYYDATNPAARDLYWKRLAGPLFAEGVDAFWLDASEPEQPNGWGGIQPGEKLYLGDSALYTNVYPFMHTLGVYQHWRKASDQKRVFILTRSSFLGEQRNAAAAWSGDIYGTFWALKRQIPAGLNFALSGMPYWTTDIGGYGFPSGSTLDPKYEEVFTRWFEFGTFCPLFRVHGHRDNNENELWSYGDASPTLVAYDRLRYRLLPYVYSLAWKVSEQDYTIMRPLVMDWRTDQRVWNLGDEFMFGPALLVSPITEAGAQSRSIYLPAAPAWYNFWSGTRSEGPRTIDAQAPLNIIPIYVRAGSIIPMGPESQYAREFPAGPIELRIYTGADGDFVLYEDQGDGYAYEKGADATIAIHWDDAKRKLSIGPRIGSFPGMPPKMTFNLVVVRPGHGVGEQIANTFDSSVVYSGEPTSVTLPITR